jgi:beta-glucosidase
VLHGAVEMSENRPVDLVIEFSTPFYPLDMFMGKHLHIGWQTAQLIPEAVSAAQQADVAVVFVNQAAGEGMDRDSFSLPASQNHLIAAVAEVNPNTIVVLNTPGAVLMPWLDKASAVLQVWYPGEAIGTAIASVLFGDADPGGRLPITFPAAETQALPQYDDSGTIEFEEGIFVGYRHYQKHQRHPLFPFGYGLSYTSFQYSDVEITPLNDGVHGASVKLTVENTGDRDGTHVVQVYVGELPVAVPTPTRQFAGFAKVELAPTEWTTVEILIPRRVISYWDESVNEWIPCKGTIALYISNSLGDEHFTGEVHINQN